VLAQTYKDYEIIVVDDASTDSTSEVLAGFGEQITIIRHDKNKEMSAARNTGIRASHGLYVAFLDADDIWMPDKLEKQVPLFERNKAVGLIYSDSVSFDENGILPGTGFERATSKGATPQAGMVYSVIFVHSLIPTLTVIVRRSCFDDVGFFDETLTACEDYDMWLRVCKKWEVDFVNEPLALYRLSANSMHMDAERMLLNKLRVQENAFAKSPTLHGLSIGTLDRCYYDYYLRLSRFYIKHHRNAEAKSVLRRYAGARGHTLAYVSLWAASSLPGWLLDFMIALRSRWRKMFKSQSMASYTTR
jgi:glycosyltransferase involved in cell wall biosynthesis